MLGQFYEIGPENDVGQEKDRRRMLWIMGDIVNEVSPLSRWRDGYKKDAEEWMAEQQVREGHGSVTFPCAYWGPVHTTMKRDIRDKDI